MSKFNHPNIVKFKRVIEMKTLLCIFMEYIDGNNLYDEIQKYN